MNIGVILQRKRQLADMLKDWRLVEDKCFKFGLFLPVETREDAMALRAIWSDCDIVFNSLYDMANDVIHFAGTFISYKNAEAVSFADIMIIEFCLKYIDEMIDMLIKEMKGTKRAIDDEEDEEIRKLGNRVYEASSEQICKFISNMTLLAALMRDKYHGIISE